MTKIIKIIEKMSFALVFVFLFFSGANISLAITSSSDQNSIYKYNALENHISFYDTLNNQSILGAKPFKNIDLLIDVTKDLQDITKKQNFSTEQIENAISTLKNRSGVKTFLIGNDLGTLRFQLIQIKGLASLFDILILKTEDNTIKIQINSQVQLLKEEQKRVESFILEQKSKFSLFGWLVNTL